MNRNDANAQPGASMMNEAANGGSRLYLFVICFVTTIGGFLFGYDTAIISGCNSFLEAHFELSKAGLGWIVSSALLGTIVGSFFAGTIADRIGRKPTLAIAAFLLTISAFGSMFPPVFMKGAGDVPWIGSSLDFAFNWLTAARLIGGVGVGVTYAVSPLFISEVTLPRIRGRMVSIYQLSITLGILFAFLADYVILTSAGDAAGAALPKGAGFWSWAFTSEIWRGMFGTEIPIALAFLLLVIVVVPESPRWLVAHARESKAMKILVRIGGRAQAQKEMADIHEVLKEEEGRFRELFKPHLRVPLLIGAFLPMFSHLSGIAAIMYYAPNILNESLQNPESSFAGAVLVGVINSVFTFVAIYKIDKFGRRGLLLAGVTGALLSLAGVGVLFAIGSRLVIIPLLLYVACFAFSYGPVVWTIIGEIFPTRVRGRAAALGAFSLSVTSFVVTQLNPIMFETITPAGTFFVYACLTIPALIFIWKLVPETKGRSLEDIERSWLERKSESV